jgi:hypothetical protein
MTVSISGATISGGVTTGNAVALVTNGMLLNLIASNSLSYPGTGTTWTDLSGYNNNGTLVNSPTYSSGNFVLDGINQYAYLPATSGFFDINTNSFFADVGYAWTVNAWFNFPVAPVGTRTGNQCFAIIGKSGGIAGAETLTLFVGSGTDSTYGAYSPYYCAVGIRGTKTIISPAPVNTNVWNNATVTWDGSAARVYFNGADIGAASTATAAAIQLGFYFSIGVTANPITGPAASTMEFEGIIGSVQAYDRALSADEVAQNFYASRGTYGV